MKPKAIDLENNTKISKMERRIKTKETDLKHISTN